MSTIAKITIARAVAVFPLSAGAVSSDVACCTTLGKIYQRTAPKHASPAVTLPLAMAQCQSGSAGTRTDAEELRDGPAIALIWQRSPVFTASRADNGSLA